MEQMTQREPVKVYELAKELGMDSLSLLDKLGNLGIKVKNHMSELTESDVAAAKAGLSAKTSTVAGKSSSTGKTTGAKAVTSKTATAKTTTKEAGSKTDTTKAGAKAASPSGAASAT
ncbi:MAG: Translation initiation factor N-terminal region, partial [Pseudomonadota bacterium]